MTEPPRRKRFQIHLSTAIVLMFVAGGLLWANTYARIESKCEWVGQPASQPDAPYNDEERTRYIQTLRGWPFSALKTSDYSFRSIQGSTDPLKSFERVPGSTQIRALWVCIDILIGLGLLGVSWFLCESLIRRRAARKGA